QQPLQPLLPAVDKTQAVPAPTSMPPGSVTTLPTNSQHLPTPARTLSPSGELDEQPRLTEDEENELPSWLRDHYKRFAEEAVGAHAPTWQYLLRDWVALERAYQYQCPKLGFPRSHRPADVDNWIHNGRRTRIVVRKPDVYEEQWTTWWRSINPAWRETVEGHTVIGGDGDWSMMYKPGTNGFLTVIGALVGLKDVTDDERWRATLCDVRWTIGKVLEAKLASNASMGHGEEETREDLNDRPTKRARRRR
ncbi:hypothetical protein K474DRAFT_1681015, partial [Panus rudis PR-1116 ss-1]